MDRGTSDQKKQEKTRKKKTEKKEKSTGSAGEIPLVGKTQLKRNRVFFSKGQTQSSPEEWQTKKTTSWV